MDSVITATAATITTTTTDTGVTFSAAAREDYRSAHVDNNPIVELDVRGVRFKTRVMTLMAVHDSLLAMMFRHHAEMNCGRVNSPTPARGSESSNVTGKWGSPNSQADGSYFLDVDPDVFRHVLPALARCVPLMPHHPPSGVDPRIWSAELQYLGVASDVWTVVACKPNDDVAQMRRCTCVPQKRRSATKPQSSPKHPRFEHEAEEQRKHGVAMIKQAQLFPHTDCAHWPYNESFIKSAPLSAAFDVRREREGVARAIGRWLSTQPRRVMDVLLGDQEKRCFAMTSNQRYYVPLTFGGAIDVYDFLETCVTRWNSNATASLSYKTKLLLNIALGISENDGNPDKYKYDVTCKKVIIEHPALQLQDAPLAIAPEAATATTKPLGASTDRWYIESVVLGHSNFFPPPMSAESVDFWERDLEETLARGGSTMIDALYFEVPLL